MQRTQVEFAVLRLKSAQETAAESVVARSQRTATSVSVKSANDRILSARLVNDAYDTAEVKALLAAEFPDFDSKGLLKRIGKRGRGAGRGGRIGKRVLKPEAVDPNARDADRDGWLQEGTTAERPAPARGVRNAVGRAMNRAADAIDRFGDRRESRRAQRKPGKVRSTVGNAAARLADRIDDGKPPKKRRDIDKGPAAAADLADGGKLPGRQFGTADASPMISLFDAETISGDKPDMDIHVVRDDKGKFLIVDGDRLKAMGKDPVASFKAGKRVDEGGAPQEATAAAADVKPGKPRKRQPGRQFGGAFKTEAAASREARAYTKDKKGRTVHVVEGDDGKFRLVDGDRLKAMGKDPVATFVDGEEIARRADAPKKPATPRPATPRPATPDPDSDSYPDPYDTGAVRERVLELADVALEDYKKIAAAIGLDDDGWALLVEDLRADPMAAAIEAYDQYRGKYGEVDEVERDAIFDAVMDWIDTLDPDENPNPRAVRPNEREERDKEIRGFVVRQAVEEYDDFLDALRKNPDDWRRFVNRIQNNPDLYAKEALNRYVDKHGSVLEETREAILKGVKDWIDGLDPDNPARGKAKRNAREGDKPAAPKKQRDFEAESRIEQGMRRDLTKMSGDQLDRYADELNRFIADNEGADGDYLKKMVAASKQRLAEIDAEKKNRSQRGAPAKPKTPGKPGAAKPRDYEAESRLAMAMGRDLTKMSDDQLDKHADELNRFVADYEGDDSDYAKRTVAAAKQRLAKIDAEKKNRAKRGDAEKPAAAAKPELKNARQIIAHANKEFDAAEKMFEAGDKEGAKKRAQQALDDINEAINKGALGQNPDMAEGVGVMLDELRWMADGKPGLDDDEGYVSAGARSNSDSGADMVDAPGEARRPTTPRKPRSGSRSKNRPARDEKPKTPNLDDVFWDEDKGVYVDGAGGEYGADELAERGIDPSLRDAPMDGVPPFGRGVGTPEAGDRDQRTQARRVEERVKDAADRYALMAMRNRGDDWEDFVAEARQDPMQIAFEMLDVYQDRFGEPDEATRNAVFDAAQKYVDGLRADDLPTDAAARRMGRSDFAKAERELDEAVILARGNQIVEAEALIEYWLENREGLDPVLQDRLERASEQVADEASRFYNDVLNERDVMEARVRELVADGRLDEARKLRSRVNDALEHHNNMIDGGADNTDYFNEVEQLGGIVDRLNNIPEIKLVGSAPKAPGERQSVPSPEKVREDLAEAVALAQDGDIAEAEDILAAINFNWADLDPAVLPEIEEAENVVAGEAQRVYEDMLVERDDVAERIRILVGEGEVEAAAKLRDKLLAAREWHDRMVAGGFADSAYEAEVAELGELADGLRDIPGVRKWGEAPARPATPRTPAAAEAPDREPTPRPATPRPATPKPSTPKPSTAERERIKREKAQEKRAERDIAKEKAVVEGQIKEAFDKMDLRALNDLKRKLIKERDKAARKMRANIADHLRKKASGRNAMLREQIDELDKRVAELNQLPPDVLHKAEIDRRVDRFINAAQGVLDNLNGAGQARQKRDEIDRLIRHEDDVLANRHRDAVRKLEANRRLEWLREQRAAVEQQADREQEIDDLVAGRTGRPAAAADEVKQRIAAHRQALKDGNLPSLYGEIDAAEKKVKELEAQAAAATGELDRAELTGLLGVHRRELKALQGIDKQAREGKNLPERFPMLDALGVVPHDPIDGRGVIVDNEPADIVPVPKIIVNPDIKSKADAIAFVRAGGSMDEVPNEYWLAAIYENSDKLKRNAMGNIVRDANGKPVYEGNPDPNNRFKEIPKNGGIIGKTYIFVMKDDDGNPSQNGWVLKGASQKDSLGEVVGYNLAAAHGIIPDGAGWDGEDNAGNKYAIVPHAFSIVADGSADIHFPDTGGNYDEGAISGSVRWGGADLRVDPEQAQKAMLGHALHNYMMGVSDRHHGNGMTIIKDGVLYAFPIDQGWAGKAGSPDSDPERWLGSHFGMHFSILADISRYHRRLPDDQKAAHKQAVAEMLDQFIERTREVALLSKEDWLDRFGRAVPSENRGQTTTNINHLHAFYNARVVALQAARDSLLRSMTA